MRVKRVKILLGLLIFTLVLGFVWFATCPRISDLKVYAFRGGVAFSCQYASLAGGSDNALLDGHYVVRRGGNVVFDGRFFSLITPKNENVKSRGWGKIEGSSDVRNIGIPESAMLEIFLTDKFGRKSNHLVVEVVVGGNKVKPLSPAPAIGI